MPRFNVEYQNRWACFSSIPDGFITPFMSLADFEAWRREEYGRAGYEPIEMANRMDMDDAVAAVFLNRTRREGRAELRRAGLSPGDVAVLLARLDAREREAP